MSAPSHLQYTTDHEWLHAQDDIATIGVTAFAAAALGDVVYVQPPAVGDRVAQGQGCGEIESTKSVSDIYSPADGEITEVNAALVDQPDLVNTDPYGAGWIFRLRMESKPEGLLDSSAYSALTGEA